MIEVQDKATGQVMELPPEQAAELIAGGKVYAKEGSQLPVVTDGVLRMVSAEDFVADLRSANPTGMVPATDQMVANEQQRFALEGYAGQAEAAAWGAARGLSVGTSDWFASEIGGAEARQRLQALKQAHPTTSIVSEIGGAIAPALLTKGGSIGITAGRLGALGKAAALSPAGLATRAGYSSAKGLSALVGRGATSAAGRALQYGVPAAAMGAVEGGIYGAGQQLSEASLGNHEITAERILFGGQGASDGFVGGALVGGALTGILGGIAGARSSVIGGSEGRMAKAAALADAGKPPSGFGEWLRNKAKSMELQSMGASNTAAKQFEALPAEAQRYVHQALDGGAITAAGLQKNAKAMAAEARSVMAKLDDAVADVKAVAEKSGTREPHQFALAKAQNKAGLEGLQVKLDAIAKKAEAFDPMYTGVAKNIRIYAKDIAERELTPTDLARFAETATFEGKAGRVTREGEFWREVRNAVQDEAAVAFDRLAAQAAPELVGTYRRALDHSLGARWVEEVSKTGAGRSLLDEGMQAAGELATGGTAGAAGTMWRTVKRQGQPVAATLARRLAHIVDPQTAVVQNLMRQNAKADARVQKAAEGFLGWLDSPKAATRAAPKGYMAAASGTRDKSKQQAQRETRERAQKIAAAVKAAQSNPTAVLDALSRDAGPLATYAPNVYGALAGRYSAAYKHLASLMPPARPMHLLSHMSKHPMDDVSAERIARAAGAIANPLGVLERMERGTVNRDELDAVRAVAPNLFAQMQNTVLAGLATEQINPDYHGRLTLSMAFRIPADASMLPASVAASQTVYKSEEVDSGADGRGALGPVNAPSRPIEGYSSAMRTREQRREERDPGGSI